MHTRDMVVPLNEDALEIVNRRGNGEVSGAVFEYRGKALKDIRGAFRTACKIAEVPDCRPHDLRRTLGSWMLMNGSPIEVVSRMLGHSSIRITEQVYAHLLPHKISDATSAAVAAMKRGRV